MPTETRAGLREALRAMGATLSAGRLASNPLAPIQRPHGSSSMLEHDRIEAIPVVPMAPPATVGFLDGIQRYSHEANLGLVPVFLAQVSALVKVRADGRLELGPKKEKRFLVVPLARLDSQQCAQLQALKTEVHDSKAEAAPHPLVDRQRAVEEIERVREQVELAAGMDFLADHQQSLLIADGAIGDFGGNERVVGVIKSHETQYLSGADLEVALTLPYRCRSSVFERTSARGQKVHTWYLRLWPWDGEDIFYGLVRVERSAGRKNVAEADELSGWLLAERTPLSSPDGRWDRLLYPIHAVEETLRAQAGSWA